MKTVIAFSVLSIITAMIFTPNTAAAGEAHWRYASPKWRCPPCIYSSQYPRRSDWPVCTPRYRWWEGYWYWDCF
jgi:hypothetical protein